MQIEANLDIVDRGELTIPTTASFKVKFCADPNCGPHFLLFDKDDKPFCEMILSQEQFLQASNFILDQFDAKR